MNFESNGNNSGIEKLRVVISQKYLPELIVTEIVLLEARQSCVVALDISLFHAFISSSISQMFIVSVFLSIIIIKTVFGHRLE